jgi:uncharacterized protein YecE (DUF72 family)
MQFGTVELDNTFYRTPAISTVKGWYAKTLPGFGLGAKVPRVITHEKMLVNCEENLKHSLGTMNELREKLGTLLFQFGYFNKSKFNSGAELLARLKPFFQSCRVRTSLRWRYGTSSGRTQRLGRHCGSTMRQWR